MFSYNKRDIGEVEAVFHRGMALDEAIQPIYSNEAPYKPSSRHPSEQHVEKSQCGRQRFNSEGSNSSEEEEVTERTVTVNGADIGDLPCQYVVEGLRGNEVPVIGTYIDPSVTIGFRYRVRCLGSDRFLFDGRAVRLMNIGMGYGKRITMDEDYFYSDTNPEGYGFSLVAVESGDCFSVQDEYRPVAEARIVNVLSQREISYGVEEDGLVYKKVALTVKCNIDYSGEKHGLMPLFTNETLALEGVAFVSRRPKTRKAVTNSISHIELSNFGTVTFEA